MRGVLVGVAAGFLIAACECGVAADELPASPTVLYFAGADGWEHGAFLHTGFAWSPDGLYNSGLVFKLLLGGGIYSYQSGALGGAEVTGRQALAALLPGWRFKADGFEVTFYAGPDFQYHQFDPDDPGNPLRGFHVGARFAADLWWQPTPWWMAATNLSFSTIGYGYSARVATGVRLFDLAFVGPEAQILGCGGYQSFHMGTWAFGCDNYWQWRAGAHVTALRTGAFEWTAAAGWVEDSDQRGGIYGRLGLLVRH